MKGIKEESLINLLLSILFLAGLACLGYVAYEDKISAKEAPSPTYNKLDTVFSANFNYKQEIEYDTTWLLNHTVISKDTVRILDQADNAQTKLESNKTLSSTERARLQELVAAGQSIRAYFKKKGMYYNPLKFVSTEDGKKRFTDEPYYSSTIKPKLEEKSIRIVHKEKGSVTPDSIASRLYSANIEYYGDQHLLFIDYSIKDGGWLNTILDDNGNVIMPLSSDTVFIKKDHIRKYLGKDKYTLYDFKGNYIKEESGNENRRDSLIIFGIALIALVFTYIVLKFILEIIGIEKIMKIIGKLKNYK